MTPMFGYVFASVAFIAVSSSVLTAAGETTSRTADIGASTTAAKGPHVCNFGSANSLELKLKKNQEVVFQCGSLQEGKLSESDDHKSAFKDKNCSDPAVGLDELCRGAKLTILPESRQPADSKPSYKLKLPDTECEVGEWYYKCVHIPAPVKSVPAELEPHAKPEEQKCIVKVSLTTTTTRTTSNIPTSATPKSTPTATPPLSPESTGPSQPQKPSGADSELQHPPESSDLQAPQSGSPQSDQVAVCEEGAHEATLSADEPVLFQCGKGMVLEPEDAAGVLDEKCEQELVLKDVAETALREAVKSAEEGGPGSAYKLSIKAASSHDVLLCYRCRLRSSGDGSDVSLLDATSEAAQKQCLMKVSVKGTASSAAPSLPEHSPVVAGLMLVSTFFLRW
ncbi:hypothetical protein BESB_034110 [Besnoitia besnoiti]|uniref:SAG-related sequence n=1 Tax=Besnoitia besnoiti TaxID=94643 RepID=A0A2A9MMD9_BESBE|nr:hypothetical protein BESB_034110 [Besnoitia besnoiti]PFH36953.1 hypothetical protein BESB_034110 [Besnoitia besnoiti]